MAKKTVDAFKVIVIGGSAGSLDVLLRLINNLPPKMNAIVIVVLHRKNDPDSLLQNLISHKTGSAVYEVEDKEPIMPNTVYIAPPDYHLLVENETGFSLDGSEKVQYSRPSIDVTFQSVARTFGPRVTGVLLSGANADGAAGMAFIKSCGGYNLVQSPASAEVGFMPQQAINQNCVDEVAATEDLPAAVNRRLLA